MAHYTYTASGRPATASIDLTDNDDPDDAFEETYTFDGAGNLTSDGTRTYVYDHNRLSQVKIGSEVQTYFLFDSGKRWRTVEAPTNSETDPDRTTFAYTGTGRLAKYVKYADGEESVQGEYTYDAVGQRARSEVTIGAAGSPKTTTDFTYTGLTLHKLEAEQKQAGTTLAKWTITYLYDEYGKPYASVYRDTTGEPANWPAPVVFGLVTTDRGDVVELLDASGEPFAAYRYDAWGNPLGAGTDGAAGMWWQTTALITDVNLAEAIAQRQVLRYAGYCYDSESGLCYLSARHYDPVSRQFLSKDLSRNDGEQSAYQYCLGNPVGLVDPSGYKPLSEDEPLDPESQSRLNERMLVWLYDRIFAEHGIEIPKPSRGYPFATGVMVGQSVIGSSSYPVMVMVVGNWVTRGDAPVYDVAMPGAKVYGGCLRFLCYGPDPEQRARIVGARLAVGYDYPGYMSSGDYFPTYLWESPPENPGQALQIEVVEKQSDPGYTEYRAVHGFPSGTWFPVVQDSRPNIALVGSYSIGVAGSLLEGSTTAIYDSFSPAAFLDFGNVFGTPNLNVGANGNLVAPYSAGILGR
jgi:RHS repeat-associated protein